MKKTILAILFCVFLCGCPVENKPAPSPEPVPVPSPTPEPKPVPDPGPEILEPSEEMKKLVSEIKQLEDKNLVEFYLAFADLVSRDTEVIQTTGQIRTAHSRAGRLMFQKTGMKGKYPGLASKIDQVLLESLGKEDVKLTEEHRAKAVETFTAIAWAVK